MLGTYFMEEMIGSLKNERQYVEDTLKIFEFEISAESAQILMEDIANKTFGNNPVDQWLNG